MSSMYCGGHGHTLPCPECASNAAWGARIRAAGIAVEYVNPPIPVRDFDWCAYLRDEHEPGSPQGYGRTREAALADLQDELDEREDA